MKNREIASLFNETADILELKNANRFRINAYRRAAQNLEGASRDVEEMASDGTLGEIPGIGKDLEAKIIEYLETGGIAYLNELREDTPLVLLDMLRVQGIGPKTAVLLYEELQVNTLEDLKRAALSTGYRASPR